MCLCCSEPTLPCRNRFWLVYLRAWRGPGERQMKRKLSSDTLHLSTHTSLLEVVRSSDNSVYAIVVHSATSSRKHHCLSSLPLALRNLTYGSLGWCGRWRQLFKKIWIIRAVRICGFFFPIIQTPALLFCRVHARARRHTHTHCGECRHFSFFIKKRQKFQERKKKKRGSSEIDR